MGTYNKKSGAKSGGALSGYGAPQPATYTKKSGGKKGGKKAAKCSSVSIKGADNGFIVEKRYDNDFMGPSTKYVPPTEHIFSTEDEAAAFAAKAIGHLDA